VTRGIEGVALALHLCMRMRTSSIAAIAATVCLAAAAAAEPIWDVPLGKDDWGAENAHGSAASSRDQRFMEVLEHAFSGDSVTVVKLGGERWSEVVDVTCDRAQRRCQATGVYDLTKLDAPRGVQEPVATADPAAALIHELDARGLCSATSCKAGAIACYWNRHDEYDGHVGVYTCRTSRAAVR